MRAPPSASATCDTSSTEGCLAANSRNSDTLCEPQTWLGPGRAAPAGQAPSGCSTANDRVGVSCGRWRRLPPVLISARSEHKVRFFPFVYSIKPYRYILAFLPRGFYILFSQKTGEREGERATDSGLWRPLRDPAPHPALCARGVECVLLCEEQPTR